MVRRGFMPGVFKSRGNPLKNPSSHVCCRAMNLMSLLRAVSLTEGVSYLVLLLVAMPLKYIWGQPLVVKYTGWAHGVLFMALGALLLLAMLRAALPFRLAVIVGIAALLPAGPFFADRLLKRHQQSLDEVS
jgi:integral membrane protein